MTDGQIVSALACLVACFMILCRIDKMVRGVTLPVVFYQHAALGLGLFGAFLLTFTEHSSWGPASISAGVVAFFALSVRRWRSGAPEGTTKPGDLDASGGQRRQSAIPFLK